MNLNKEETNTQLDKNRIQESTPGRDNASVGVIGLKDPKLEAMKQVVMTNRKKKTKLKLPKKGKKKGKNDTSRNKSSRETLAQTLRSNIPKTGLQSKQVRRNVWSPPIQRETYDKIKLRIL